MFKLRSISIKTKLTVYSILTVVLFSIFISLSSYNASKSAIEKQAGQLVSTSVEQIMKRSDLFLRNVHNIALTKVYDSNFTGFLSDDQFDYTKDFTQVLRFMNNTLLLNSVNAYIHSISVYDLKHGVILSSRGINSNIQEDDENYKIIRDNFINKKYFQMPFLWIGGRKEKVGEELRKADTSLSAQKGEEDISMIPITENVVTLMIRIIDKFSTTFYGVMIINISEKSIASVYSGSSLASSGDFFIEDSQGKIISAVNKDLLGTENNILKQNLTLNKNSFLTKIDGREYLVTSFKSDYNGWQYISKIPINELMKENIKSIQQMFFLIVFAAVSLSVIVSFAFNGFFYKPVKDLINGIKASVKNHEEINIKIKREDEIGFIFNSVNDILKENSKLIKEVYEQKISSKNSELRLLQSQINPHFLYNSLYTAIGMMTLDDIKGAITIVESLIELFRLSLGKGNEIITVRQSLDHLNNYITIQKARYMERLNIEIDIDNDVMDYKILKLLLQPLVENSIFHGIEKKVDMGTIKITGEKTNGFLKFVVEDDGVGISEDKLNEISSKLINSGESDENNFYALQNINKRVRLYYGEQYGITIESRENIGTVVTLTLPAVF